MSLIHREHTLGDILDQARKSNETRIQEIMDMTHEVSSLPNGVQKFVGDVNKHFNQTIDALHRRSDELRRAADECDDRARRLSDAAPHLTRQIEEWISFERDCAVRQQSLALVKPE